MSKPPQVVDDVLLATLRAERDRATDPRERAAREYGLEFMTARRGMPLAQANAEAKAELQKAKSGKQETKKKRDKLAAAYAAMSGGYFLGEAPVAGSYNVSRLSTPAAAVAGPALTASQVIDRHAQLHDKLAHPSGTLIGLMSWYGEWADRGVNPETPAEVGGMYAGGWLTRYMLAPYKVGGQRPRADWEAKFLTNLSRGLFTAATYQVTTPMCEIAEAMYEQTAEANGHIEAADLPSETGFLWLDKPFLRLDAKGDSYGTRAVTWQPQSLRRHGGDPEDGVRITLWSDLGDDPDIPAGKIAPETDEIGPLLPVMSVAVPFGADFGGPSDDGIPMPLHYVHAVWMLTGTEVAVTGRGEVNRGTRKRVLKSIRHDQVTVIILRRGHHDSDREAGHRDIDWSCRWIVRGFWRHQWGHGTVGHPHTGQPGPGGVCLACGARITWVRPYVKGPDDQPLKATRTLYRLSR